MVFLSSFTWEYYDKTKQYTVVEDLEPKAFYENFVKSLYNVENKVIYLDIFSRKIY